jgi:hypothetical protein
VPTSLWRHRATLALVMLWLGGMKSDQFWPTVALGAGIGALVYSNFWYQDIRDTWMQEPLTLRRLGAILGVSAVVFFVLWLILRSRS